VVLAAVTQNGLALEFAHGILQADKEIVQAAMRQGGAAAFSLASEQFHGQWRRECRRGDKEFILGAIRRGEWWAFEHAKEELRGDREIVLAVVQKNGEMVSYASADLQDDLGVVLEAVRRRGQALQYASAKMQENREVIFAAIKQAGKKVLPWVSQQFQRERVEEFTHGDKDFILAAIRNNEWWALESAKEEIRGDREVGLAAITQSGMALEFVSEVLKDDREFVLAAVKKNGAALQYASERLRSDRGVVLAAIENNKAALRYASRAIQADQELAEIAADEWGFEDLLPEDGVYGIGQ
jgi:uncharacterized protein YqjF (DUF2071 family)